MTGLPVPPVLSESTRALLAGRNGHPDNGDPYAELPHPVEVDTPPPLDPVEFWEVRPVLAAVRDMARSRLVGPWAVLGAVLATVCSRVGPHVVLPPIVASAGSLNTLWALVGPSGSGKSAAESVARELLGVGADTVPTHEVGTGQGIDGSYATMGKSGPLQFCDSVLFTIAEIDTLAGHARMLGSTVMPTLRKAYSGERLGSQYADQLKRRPVRAHHYRLAVVAGVQPARAGILLNDADGGTPQRWVWMPANDPDVAEDAGGARTELPAGGWWEPPAFLAPYGERTRREVECGECVSLKPWVELGVCEAARSVIVADRRMIVGAPLGGQGADTLGAHRNLTRLKVAALLALLDGGRTDVDDEDWVLAGVVMVVSDETRRVCEVALSASAHRANVGQAQLEIERADVVAEHNERRAARWLHRALSAAEQDGWVPRAVLRRRMASRDRPLFEAALGRLVDAGVVEGEVSGRGGERYRLAGS